jgi:CubicO group peptidase (beta-lactamase class C family)
MRYIFVWICLIAFSSTAATAQITTPTFISDSLDSYITKGLKDWNIPGLAIAIVKDGKTVCNERFWCERYKNTGTS